MGQQVKGYFGFVARKQQNPPIESVVFTQHPRTWFTINNNAINPREGIVMDMVEILLKAWPVFLAFITLVIVLAKMDVRIGVLEDKVKSLFDLYNKGK